VLILLDALLATVGLLIVLAVFVSLPLSVAIRSRAAPVRRRGRAARPRDHAAVVLCRLRVHYPIRASLTYFPEFGNALSD
jgi:hypothetical protein